MDFQPLFKRTVEGRASRPSKPGGGARLSTSTTSQNEYFNENCTSRGVPLVWESSPTALAPLAFVASTFALPVNCGFWNDGWLNRLKNSVRKCRLCRSPNLNALPSVKSTFTCFGPMMQLRGESPKPVGGVTPGTTAPAFGTSPTG